MDFLYIGLILVVIVGAIFIGFLLKWLLRTWREQEDLLEDDDFPIVRKAEWYSHDSKVRRIVDLNDNHLLNAQKWQWHKMRAAKKKLARLNRELRYRELIPLSKVAPDLEIEDYD